MYALLSQYDVKAPSEDMVQVDDLRTIQVSAIAHGIQAFSSLPPPRTSLASPECWLAFVGFNQGTQFAAESKSFLKPLNPFYENLRCRSDAAAEKNREFFCTLEAGAPQLPLV